MTAASPKANTKAEARARCATTSWQVIDEMDGPPDRHMMSWARQAPRASSCRRLKSRQAITPTETCMQPGIPRGPDEPSLVGGRYLPGRATHHLSFCFALDPSNSFLPLHAHFPVRDGS